MPYTYITTTAVPERIVRAICDELIDNTVHNIIGTDVDLTDDQVRLIRDRMVEVRDSICADNHTDVDGWELSDGQVTEIACELGGFRKIGAIKAFRAATGAGLRDSKEFIDKFCTGPRSDSGPMAATNFTMAFNK